MKQHKKTYGKIILRTAEPEQIELNIIECVQSHFIYGRTITINKSEENTYLLSVKNSESSGRNPKATMHLTKESMIGLYALISVYFQVSGIDYENELNKIIIGEQFKISCSDNL